DEFSGATTVTVESTAVTGINAQLPKYGSVSGTVTERVSGHPLEGVLVSAWGYEEFPTRPGSWGRTWVYTDAAGKYEISGVGGPIKLQFERIAAPFGRYYSDKMNLGEADTVTVPAGTLVPGMNQVLPGPGAISGKLTWTDTGEGIGYRTVVAISAEDSGNPALGGQSTTFPDGTYSIGDLAPGDYFVYTSTVQPPSTIYFDGHTEAADAETVTVTDCTTTAGIDFALVPPPTGFVGTLAEEGTSLAIPDAVVHFYRSVSDPLFGDYWEYTAFDWTDSGGSYELTGMPLGSYRAFFFDPDGGHAFEFWSDRDHFDEADTAQLTGPGLVVVNASLGTGSSISGTVTESGTALPLEGVEVVAYRWNGSGTSAYWDVYLSTTTDADGKYTIKGLRGSSYVVEFYDPEMHHATQYYSGKKTMYTGTLLT
ncbi:MAG: hypothetical protein FDZ75_05735, partial [Actinobacteria bacterium]